MSERQAPGPWVWDKDQECWVDANGEGIPPRIYFERIARWSKEAETDVPCPMQLPRIRSIPRPRGLLEIAKELQALAATLVPKQNHVEVLRRRQEELREAGMWVGVGDEQEKILRTRRKEDAALEAAIMALEGKPGAKA